MNIGNKLDNTILHKQQILLKQEMGQQIRFNGNVLTNYDVVDLFIIIRHAVTNQIRGYRKNNK